ncbi:DUF4062 domain-containing protein [Stenotrophomonas maltophilia]|uniref:DUF4062 domain-containing protein n=1 Tax=Stenotrophomonas maltophilia TaxID=40324 RepID=UPI0021C5BC25|nr:DUF4062 domain-containing protein [Stenotrophomonas maltophilia]MCU1025967.1 hypothetical protein [Stenotrophomonas maltophilia]
MPYSATVLSVLIASPSDVKGERLAIAETLHEWNSLNAQSTGYVLLPVMWESHSAPAMGERPQEIINRQVVRDCDMLVGAFWTRLGSPTGVEESGTVEEVRWFLRQNKPVMLYYSKQQVDLDRIDTNQLEKLKQFKSSIRDKGIQADYSSIPELKQILLRHLTIVMRDISVSPKVDAKTVKKAKESVGDDDSTSRSRSSSAKPKAKNTVWLEDYTEKAFVVRGATTEFATELKSLNGKWIALRSGGKGWMFSKRRLEDVAKVLGIKASLAKEA